MIHLFKFKDLNIAADIESGAIHVVSGVVYDLLSASAGNGMEHKGDGSSCVAGSLRGTKGTAPTVFQKEPFPLCSSTKGTVPAVSPSASAADLRDARAEIDGLVREGLLFAEPLPEALVSPERREPVIKAICLHVAHDCNMRCAYCFAGTGEYSGERSLLSAETGRKAIDFLLARSGGRRNLEIDFFGGEPLMNFGVVRELVRYGRERERALGKNIRFTLTTNGLLLNEENTAFINEHMDNVILSVDGRPEVNDRMRRTVGGDGTYGHIIGKLLKFAEERERAGKLYYVRGTYTAYNRDFAKDVEHLASLGFRNISVEPVVAPEEEAYALKDGDLPELLAEYDRLANLMIESERRGAPISFFHFNIDLSQGPCVFKRAAGCGAGTEYAAIAANGDIYPCHQFVGEPAYLLGNVGDANVINAIASANANANASACVSANAVNGNFVNVNVNSASANDADTQKNIPPASLITDTFSAAHIYRKPACMECWAKYWCSGGCHANAVHMNGDILKPHEFGCALERKRLECAIGLACYTIIYDNER